MESFVITDYEVELFNTRTPQGALRALHLTGKRGGDVVSATLWLLTGEPRPSVTQTGPLCWEASFPLSQYEAIVELLRSKPRVWLALDEPDSVKLCSCEPGTGVRC